jgi:dihydroorotate dehydrogenase (fumarate)/dihydroorotate dehydrogenase
VTWYERAAAPLLFRADPEWIHDRSLRTAELLGALPWLCDVIGKRYAGSHPRLHTTVAGLHLHSPIGLAAGYDKNGRGVNLLSSLGFGHVEVGSVSAAPSAGNPAPRLWRIPADQGIVVHYGVPNDGADLVGRRLGRRPTRRNHRRPTVPVGVNLVNTNHGPSAAEESVPVIIADYARSAGSLHDQADYLCLNLSCPNTEDGRGFFHHGSRLAELLAELAELPITKPVFLKVAPFNGTAELGRFLETAGAAPFVAGFSVNLPPGKPAGLRTPPEVLAGMPGAVSGPPSRARAEQTVRELYLGMDRRRHAIIGSGGVSSAADAYRMIRLGASLVQVFTALVYHGPGVIRAINDGLAELLERDGFGSIGEAVGADMDLSP